MRFMHRTDYVLVALQLARFFFFILACFILFFIRCGIAFDTLRSYDNAALLRFKCPIKALFFTGRLSNVSAVKIKMIKTGEKFPFV